MYCMKTSNAIMIMLPTLLWIQLLLCAASHARVCEPRPKIHIMDDPLHEEEAKQTTAGRRRWGIRVAMLLRQFILILIKNFLLQVTATLNCACSIIAPPNCLIWYMYIMYYTYMLQYISFSLNYSAVSQTIWLIFWDLGSNSGHAIDHRVQVCVAPEYKLVNTTL